MIREIKMLLGWGWWRVIYPGGEEWTVPMNYEQAIEFQNLYGGELEEATGRFARRTDDRKTAARRKDD